MERRAAGVAVAVVVGVAGLWVLRTRDSDSQDDEAGVLHASQVTPAEVGFETTTLSGGLQHDPLAVGDVLVSTAGPDGAPASISVLPSDVVYSTDDGVTWSHVEPVEQPVDETENLLTDFILHPVEGGAALEISTAPPEPDEPAHIFLWLTTDGIQWHGGELSFLDLRTQYVHVVDIWREDGGVYATVLEREDVEDPDADDDGARMFVVRTVDNGVSWEEADCPSATPPSGWAGICPGAAAGELLVSPDDHLVSADAGRTWVEPELPDIDRDEVEGFHVVQRPEGGWLARAAERQGEAEYSGLHYYLLRSRDGIHWERLFDHDTRCDDRFHSEWFSTPVPFGRRWLVAYSCRTPVGDPPPLGQNRYLSQLLVLSADGSSVRPIAGATESKYLYTQPTAMGDRIAVALRRNAVPYTNLRTLTPP